MDSCDHLILFIWFSHVDLWSDLMMTANREQEASKSLIGVWFIFHLIVSHCRDLVVHLMNSIWSSSFDYLQLIRFMIYDHLIRLRKPSQPGESISTFDYLQLIRFMIIWSHLISWWSDDWGHLLSQARASPGSSTGTNQSPSLPNSTSAGTFKIYDKQYAYFDYIYINIHL